MLDPFSSFPLVVKLDVEVPDEQEFSDEPSPDDDDDDDDDGEGLFFPFSTNLFFLFLTNLSRHFLGTEISALTRLRFVDLLPVLLCSPFASPRCSLFIRWLSSNCARI